MEVLQFIFKDFWHWLGAIFLVAVAATWRPFIIDKSIDNSTNTYMGEKADD